MTLWKWSQTAATNATADSTINWAEGQAPSTINDSARAMMAATSKYRDDNAGTLTTGGTSTAYTLTSNQGFDTLAHMSGQKLTVRFNATNGATPTLNVDSLGAKSIYLDNANAIPTGMLKANSVWDVTYDNSIPAFIVNSVPASLPSGVGVAATLAATQSPMLFGRYSASAGNGQEITLGSGISMSGSGVLSAATAAGVQVVNGTIAQSNGANAVTFSLKTLAGADPSSTDPVYVIFRNATAATGNFVVRTVTAAMSLTISAGSTMGTTNNVACRLWIGLLDNAGTVEMFAINCLSGSNIYPLGQFPLITTTAEGGAGASDSAHVPYSTTARTSKPYIVFGYAEYASGLSTAGNWNVDPTRIQLYGPGVKLPGDVIQTQRNATGTVATGSTAVPWDNTIPQNTEGDQYMSQAITPTSAANLLEVSHIGTYTSSTTANLAVSLYQDSNANSLATSWFLNNGSGNPQTVPLEFALLSGTTSSTTLKIRAGTSTGTVSFNGSAGSQFYGGVLGSFLRVREIVA